MPWFWISLLLSGVDWIFAYRRIQMVRQYTRLVPWIAMLIWMLTQDNWGQFPLIFVTVAITFAWISEIMMRAKGAKMPYAFIVFSLSVLTLSVPLNTGLPPFNFSTVLFASIVFMVMFRIFLRVRNGEILKKKRAIQTPVTIYLLSSAGLLLAGLTTLANPGWSPLAALAAASGTVFIAIASILTSWVYGVEPLPHSSLIKTAPLHIGFLLVIVGTLLQFG